MERIDHVWVVRRRGFGTMGAGLPSNGTHILICEQSLTLVEYGFPDFVIRREDFVRLTRGFAFLRGRGLITTSGKAPWHLVHGWDEPVLSAMRRYAWI